MSPAPLGWIVTVTVGPGEVDRASGLLWDLGVTAIEERPADDGSSVALRAGVGAGGDPGAVLGAVDGRWAVAVEAVTSGRWMDTWQAHARMSLVGRRLEVRPTWLEGLPPPAPGSIPLALPPHRAFGTGSHPTTRLALAALERLVPPATSVLDVGSGSGLLATAAARCGAAEVVALDIDAAARAATAATAAANGVSDRVSVSDRAPHELGRTFDVVVANMVVDVLEDLLVGMVGCVRPGGSLVLSGVLDAQVGRILGRCESAGCHLVERSGEDGWALVVTEREDLGP